MCVCVCYLQSLLGVVFLETAHLFFVQEASSSVSDERSDFVLAFWALRRAGMSLNSESCFAASLDFPGLGSPGTGDKGLGFIPSHTESQITTVLQNAGAQAASGDGYFGSECHLAQLKE